MSVIRMPTGRNVFYDALGEGPPLLIIPGMTSDRRGADARLAHALAVRHRVVIMDLRDSGESPPETGSYSITDLAADALALLAGLGIERAHVLGHSLGGMVALQIALDSPEYLDRLILVSTVAQGTQDNGAREPFPPPAPWWIEDPVERVRRTLPRLVGAEYLAALDDAEAESIAASYQGNRVTWAGMLRQGAAQANHDLQARLGEVRAPTLVVHGEADTLVTAEHGVVLASGIPGAKLLELPGVGHFPWIERPGDVIEGILSFLGGES